MALRFSCDLSGRILWFEGNYNSMLPRLSLFSALNAARLGLALTGLSALPASAASPGFQTLPGHIPAAAIAAAQPVSALDSAQTVRLALALPLHRQAELDDLLRGLYDPADPRCGQFLTSAQFSARFSPTPAEYGRVAAYAKALGLTVTGTHANRTVLDVSAPAGQIGKAFGLRLLQYKSLADGRVFYAPNAEPQVPSSLGGLVSGIVGLSSASRWQPHLREKAFPAVSPALDPYAAGRQTGSGPYGGLSPSDIKTAYNLSSVPQTGAGQTLALFELDGYTASDITVYETKFGLPNVPLQNILVDGYSGAAGGGANEVTLDIELQAALAPGATKILVYEGPNSDTGVVDTYTKIAADNAAKQISTSWGLAENSNSASVRNSENAAFQQMAAQGQSIYAAAGDSGANDNGSSLSVDDPASQPYMTGVGGTTLSTVSAGGAYKSETTWNNGSAANGAGGGGVSTVWPIPSYQTSVAGTAASKGSKTNRNVPDVSLDSDPNTGYSIYFGGNWTIYGGTSCASPLWAAFTALVNQKRAAAGNSTLGFANTPLYALATTGTYAADFHDIADGSTNLFYPAVTGYDDATGLGTFNGANLLADLGGSPAPTTTATINDTDSALAYVGGGWRYYPRRGLGDSGDDVHATQANGDSVSYTFTGTAISYITETNSDEGNVQVYLDGTLQATVSAFSATRKVQQTLWSAASLASGSHTLKLVKADGTFLLLDAVIVSPAPVPSATVNDTDSALAYVGGWRYYPQRGLGDSGDDVHATQANGDSVSYTFTGTGVSYVTETNSDEGNVQVYLDGVLKTTVNCAAAGRAPQQSVYSVSALTPGSHTIKLIKASGTFMLLDAFITR